MTQQIIDLTGRPTLTVGLNIDRPTQRAIVKRLTQKHIDEATAAGREPDPNFTPVAPTRIVLRLREATLRDQNEWNEGRQTLGVTDPILWTAQLLQDRAEEDIDIDVLREVVLGMDEGTIAQFQQAYVTGTLQDPKVMSSATASVKKKMTTALLGQLAAGEISPYLPDTSALDPGNVTD